MPNRIGDDAAVRFGSGNALGAWMMEKPPRIRGCRIDFNEQATSPSPAWGTTATWLFAWCLLTTASCEYVYTAGVAVIPAPGVSVDTTRDVALALMARIARQHRLDDKSVQNLHRQGWAACFERNAVQLCGKTHEQEVQFMVYYRAPTPLSDSIHRELFDSLRVRFGPSKVRECQWESMGEASGCPPLAIAHLSASEVTPR